MNDLCHSWYRRGGSVRPWTCVLLLFCLAILFVWGCGESRLEKYCGELKDFDEDTRQDAAEELGELGDRRAVSALIGALEDYDEDVRAEAAKSLGLLGDAAAVQQLMALLHDPEKKVRRRAVAALGKIADPVAVDSLLRLLTDPSSEIREETVEALGRIGSPAALTSLEGAARSDPDEDVRNKAGFAIRRIKERQQQ